MSEDVVLDEFDAIDARRCLYDSIMSEKYRMLLAFLSIQQRL